MIKPFRLWRSEDVSGVSGTGVVAEGAVFHNGKTIICWFGEHSSIEVHDSIDAAIAIHGHGGKTQVVYD